MEIFGQRRVEMEKKTKLSGSCGLEAENAVFVLICSAWLGPEGRYCAVFDFNLNRVHRPQRSSPVSLSSALGPSFSSTPYKTATDARYAFLSLFSSFYQQ